MTTITIYVEQSAMAQGVAQHATGPPHTFRTVADDRTGCRNVRPSKPQPSAFRTLGGSPRPGDGNTSGSPQPGDGSTSGSPQPGDGSTSGSPQPGDGSTSGSPQISTRKLLSGFPQPRALRTETVT
ncbi:repeat domain-containing protein [Plakobranchus ocellatus]|uniref:Repeat domain-containing protein n=1 Tax=Plakobranchus ocellatus TaxID=259542 RepID=A0AAV3Z324_9GAST|nr:repeat domain-containing protein [Plakobranchus ocellatus]